MGLQEEAAHWNCILKTYLVPAPSPHPLSPSPFSLPCTLPSPSLLPCLLRGEQFFPSTMILSPATSLKTREPAQPRPSSCSAVSLLTVTGSCLQQLGFPGGTPSIKKRLSVPKLHKIDKESGFSYLRQLEDTAGALHCFHGLHTWAKGKACEPVLE